MVKQAEKSIGIRAYFPIMGLVLAISVGVLAYFLAPELIKLLAGMEFQGTPEGEFYRKLDILYSDPSQIHDALMNTKAQLAFAALLWLIIFSTMMVFVSAAIGEDPDKEFTILQPRKGDIKGAKKFVAE